MWRLRRDISPGPVSPGHLQRLHTHRKRDKCREKRIQESRIVGNMKNKTELRWTVQNCCQWESPLCDASVVDAWPSLGKGEGSMRRASCVRTPSAGERPAGVPPPSFSRPSSPIPSRPRCSACRRLLAVPRRFAVTEWVGVRWTSQPSATGQGDRENDNSRRLRAVDGGGPAVRRPIPPPVPVFCTLVRAPRSACPDGVCS